MTILYTCAIFHEVNSIDLNNVNSKIYPSIDSSGKIRDAIKPFKGGAQLYPSSHPSPSLLSHLYPSPQFLLFLTYMIVLASKSSLPLAIPHLPMKTEDVGRVIKIATRGIVVGKITLGGLIGKEEGAGGGWSDATASHIT